MPEEPSSIVSDDLLARFRCPVTGDALQWLDDDSLHALNAAIASRTAYNQCGELLERLLDRALINQRGSLVYPLRDGVPILLKQEAITVNAFSSGTPEQS